MKTIIEKQEIIPILLEYYSQLLKEATYQEHLFQKKYKHFFEDFELYINNTNKENFEEWDDYMEWKSFRKSIENYEQKIKSIKHGDFKP